MARAKRYNWTLLGTTPARVLELAPHWRFGRGQELPEEIDWTQTPQGARFWYLAFLKGDKRAEAALSRMIRQAGDDKKGAPVRGPIPYTPQAYDVRKIVISPDHVLATAHVFYLVRKPPMSVQWVWTPQGPAYWYDYFAQSPETRDKRVIDGLLAAVVRFKKLEGEKK